MRQFNHKKGFKESIGPYAILASSAINELQNTHQLLDSTKSAYEAEMNSAKDSFDQLVQLVLQDLNTFLTFFNENITEFFKTEQTKTDSFLTKTDQIRQKVESFKNVLDENQELHTLLEGRQEELDKMVQYNQELLERLDEVSSLEEDTTELDILKKENEQLRKELEELKQSNQKLADAEIAIADLSTRNTELTETLQETNCLKEEIQNELLTLKTAVIEKERTEQRETETLDTLRKELATAEADREELSEKLREMTERAKDAEAMRETYRGLNRIYEQKLSAADEQVRELSNHLPDTNKPQMASISISPIKIPVHEPEIETHETSGREDQLRNEIDHAYQEINALQNDLSHANTALYRSEEEKRQLHAEIEGLRRRLEEITANATLDLNNTANINQRLSDELSNNKILQRQIDTLTRSLQRLFEASSDFTAFQDAVDDERSVLDQCKHMTNEVDTPKRVEKIMTQMDNFAETIGMSLTGFWSRIESLNRRLHGITANIRIPTTPRLIPGVNIRPIPSSVVPLYKKLS